MIFTIINEVPQITLEGIYIPEFKEIWNNEKNKDVAQQKLAFIYHYCQSQKNNNNPYFNFPTWDKKDIIKKDYIEDESWVMEDDKLVMNAIEKYNILIDTPSSKMLVSAISSVHRLSEYFENIDFTKTKIDRDGNEIDYYDPKKIVDTLKNLSGVVKTLQELKIQVDKEWEGAKGRMKGTQTLSIFDE